LCVSRSDRMLLTKIMGYAYVSVNDAEPVACCTKIIIIQYLQPNHNLSPLTNTKYGGYIIDGGLFAVAPTKLQTSRLNY